MVGRYLRSLVVTIAACFLISAEPRTAGARDPDLLSFGAGAFDVADVLTAGQFRLEYKSGYELLWIIKPLVGVMGTTDGGFYGYGGILMDLEVGSIVFTPSVAVGYYAEGDGKDLGNEVEFQFGGEISYKFENNMRLGVAFFHMSNAGLSEKNRGTEIVQAVFSIPLNF